MLSRSIMSGGTHFRVKEEHDLGAKRFRTREFDVDKVTLSASYNVSTWPSKVFDFICTDVP